MMSIEAVSDAINLQSQLKAERLEQLFKPKDNSIARFSSLPAPKHTVSNSLTTLLAKQQEDMVRNTLQVDETISKKTNKQTISQSKQAQDFIQWVWPYAQKVSHLIGIDPKVLVAQAALETGWGKFIAKDANGNSSNNLFNIKATNTDKTSVTVKTTEFEKGLPVKQIASFKTYPSVEDSFQDYITFLNKNPRYKDALAQTDDPQRFIQSLQDAGYATDPDYANKIAMIYASC